MVKMLLIFIIRKHTRNFPCLIMNSDIQIQTEINIYRVTDMILYSCRIILFYTDISIVRISHQSDKVVVCLLWIVNMSGLYLT